LVLDHFLDNGSAKFFRNDPGRILVYEPESVTLSISPDKGQAEGLETLPPVSLA